MKPRAVYIIGSVLAIAVFSFAIWHAMQPRPAPNATPVASAGAPGPIPAQQEPTKEETANVPRIEQEDLLNHFKAGDVTIIDVRDADSYMAGHIPGALHIPLARVEGEVPYLPKSKPIVTYCT